MKTRARRLREAEEMIQLLRACVEILVAHAPPEAKREILALARGVLRG